jgi:multidrug efflux pump subunit AcrB
MIFWPGVVGDFMSYLPITVIITLSSSLFVALVINPVLASRFMKIETKEKKPVTLFEKIIHPFNIATHYFNDNMLPATLKNYEKLLDSTVGQDPDKGYKLSKNSLFGFFGTFGFMILVIIGIGMPQIPNEIVIALSIVLGFILLKIINSSRVRVLSGSILMLMVIILIYKEFDHGVEFFPAVDPPRININVESPTGTNLEMSNRIAQQIEQRLKPFAKTDVKEYITSVGSSSNPFSGGGSNPNASTITVQFVDFNDRTQTSKITTDQIRNAVADIAGGDIEVKKQQMGPPVGQPVNIEIIGDDLKVLGLNAELISEKIKDIPGVVDLKDDYDDGRPEVRVDIDREKAALYSMNTSIIANTIRTAVNGTEASKYRINEDEYDITVRLQEDQRKDLDALRNLRIIFNDKKGKTLSIPLSAVAEINYDKGPGAVRRKDLKRVITVSSNVDEGYNDNEVLDSVKAKLADFKLPPGYKIDFTGQNEEQAKAASFLGRAFMIAFFGIFLILVIQFNSLSQPLIIMAAVTISLIGVFIGLTLFSLPFGIIMTGIGVISLAGVVVNNNIVLIDYTNILRKRGLPAREAVKKAGIRRFRPVTLTAITTILGLIPLTFGFGFDIYSFSFESGGTEAAFWRSMGVAVIFGLLFGTILTLLIVPTMYSVTEELPLIWKSIKRDYLGISKNG